MGFMNRYREIPHRGREIDHICENLHHIFNSRRGYGSPIQNFGLDQPDPHTDSVGAAKQILAEMIRDIHQFEPRLAGPTLRTTGRSPDLKILIELRARLHGKLVQFRLRYSPVYGGVDVEAAEDV